MKIGIVGSRRRDSDKDYYVCLKAFLKIYEEGDIIVSGGCPQGGDRFAEQIGRKFGCTIIIHYPDWNKYGKSAGFKRNSKIAEDSNILIAVVAKDRKGGTEDTIKKFLEKNKKHSNRLILVEEE